MTDNDTTRLQLSRNVKGIAEDLERLVSIAQECSHDDPKAIIALFEEHGYEEFAADPDDPDEYDASDAAETATEILNNWPLEAYEVGRRSPGGEWEHTHTVVVFGTGGPHIELDTSEGAIMGYWGGDRASFPVDQDVCDYFEQWFDQ